MAKVTDEGSHSRWGVGRFFYRRDGAKLTLDSKKLKWASFGLLALVSILLALQPLQETTSIEPGVQPPTIELGQATVEIPEYVPTPRSDPRPVKRNPRPSTFGGPQVVRFGVKDIPPGTMIKAKLETGASNGPLRAVVTEEASFGGGGPIASGTVLLGEGASTDSRLLIRFHAMVFKDGSHRRVDAQAYDFDDRIPGLKGSKLGAYGSKLAASIGLNFVGGLSEGLQEYEGSDGVATRKASLKNGLLNGAAKASLEQSQEMMRELRNRQPIIEVPSDTPILVVFGGKK